MNKSSEFLMGNSAYRRGYEQGRADAIEEFASLVESAFLHTKFDITDVRPMAEQLKEQSK